MNQAVSSPDQIEETRRTFDLLYRPGDVFEVRAFHCGRVKTVSGYFDNRDLAAEAVAALEQRKPSGVYCTINPVLPALLARANNRLVEWPKETTTDSEILTRRWLPIDIDPVRPSGIAATVKEMTTASDLAKEIEDVLRSRGWSYPIVAHSGNGHYLLYRVDLPNDTATTAMLKAFYRGLQTLIDQPDTSGPHSKIDVGVFNPARVLRVSGTINRKGDDTNERPHRPCIWHPPIDDCPVDPIPRDLIQRIGEMGPTRQPSTQPSSNGRHRGNGRSSKLDVRAYLGGHGIAFKEKPLAGGMAFLLTCPFDPNHGVNGESSLIQSDSGLLTFHCMHDSCQHRRWQDFRDAVGSPEPTHWTGHATGQADGKADDQAAPSFDLELVSSAQFSENDYRQNFLIKKILVAQQPGVIGGPHKSIKTGIACDLAISLGTATPFLGMFDVAQQVPVMLLSGESGAFTLQETARRIALARGRLLSSSSVFWGFRLPQITRAAHLDVLANEITNKQIKLCIIDPAFQCLLAGDTTGRQPSNLFAMGSVLFDLTQLGQDTNCTILLIHHTRKNSANPFAVTELPDLAFSGFAEWSRQWLLLGRRSAYEPGTGQHQLWLNVGGSAGHGGTWAIDLDEGVIDDDFNGRKWDLSVSTASDAREQATANRKTATDTRNRDKIIEALRLYPAGETATALRDVARVSGTICKSVLRELVRNGIAETITVNKSNGPHDGFKLVVCSSPNDTQQNLFENANY